MNTTRLLAVLMVVGGVVALGINSFSFTKETHTANLGPMVLSVDETETVTIPAWASLMVIAAGAGLMALSFKRA